MQSAIPRALRPNETLWLTWSEVQGARVMLHAIFVRAKRQDFYALARRLGATDQAAAHSCRHFDQLLERIRAGEFTPDRSPSEEPSFNIRGLPLPILDRIRQLRATGRSDTGKIIEMYIRYGCRGHRNFVDRHGRPLPFRFARPDGSYTVMSEETFQLYEFNGIVHHLAAAIMVQQELVERSRTEGSTT